MSLHRFVERGLILICCSSMCNILWAAYHRSDVQSIESGIFVGGYFLSALLAQELCLFPLDALDGVILVFHFNLVWRRRAQSAICINRWDFVSLVIHRQWVEILPRPKQLLPIHLKVLLCGLWDGCDLKFQLEILEGHLTLMIHVYKRVRLIDAINVVEVYLEILGCLVLRRRRVDQSCLRLLVFYLIELTLGFTSSFLFWFLLGVVGWLATAAVVEFVWRFIWLVLDALYYFDSSLVLNFLFWMFIPLGYIALRDFLLKPLLPSSFILVFMIIFSRTRLLWI